jgi:Asp-tRNA(Asn)/Glu-tRNA(Gln) amidotransferase A subunit family amidase
MKKPRRAFLKHLPAVVGAGLAARAVAGSDARAVAVASPGQAPAAAPQGGITAETLAAAQQVAGVSLLGSEREAARPLVAANLANIDAVRRVALPAEIEPAFAFRPPRPPREAARPAPSVRRAAPRPAPPGKLPPPDELAFEPATVLAARLRARQITSVELTSLYLERLKRHDATLFCVVTLTEDLAREQAAAADREIRAGRLRGPLHGVPYGIKDLFAAKGVPTTWGAKPYAEQVFDYDATAVVRLRNAGAVLLGKLATGELAVGDLWFRGRTRNPWNPARGSSGSSAGPASAAAAGLVGFAVGTETNGSIVSPASTCGVAGLRPTYGRISRFGCMTLRWTLDKVGALARSVADTAAVLEALHGPDGRDETVPDLPFAWDGRADVRGLRIGVVERELGGTGNAAMALAAACDVYRKAGATIVSIALPDSPAAAIYALLNAEAGAMFDELVRTGGIADLADTGVNGRANQLRASRFIPAVDYVRAQRARTLLLAQMNRLFESVEAVLSTPASAAVVMGNLTGHPAITVPAGFADGLPVGVLVTGPLFREERVLQVAAAFEAATTWHARRPPGFAAS